MHLFVASGEGVRDLEKVGELGQLVTADHQSKTEPAVAELPTRTRVYEWVVAGPSSASFLGLLDRAKDRQVRAPRSYGRGLSDGARRFCRQRRARRVFSKSLNESVWCSIGRERERRFVLLEFFEVSDAPLVRCEQTVAHQCGERWLSPPLQLDERLNRFIDRERGGVSKVRRADLSIGGEHPGAGERPLTIHSDFDRKKGESAWEVLPQQGGRHRRQHGEDHPKSRLLGHFRAIVAHARLYFRRLEEVCDGERGIDGCP